MDSGVLKVIKRYCPKCGKENPEDADFCMQCGEDMQRVKMENVEERLREVYPEKDAQRFANSFRIILDIQSNYCNENTKLEDIDRALELLRAHLKDKPEFISEADDYLKRISFGSRDKTETIRHKWETLKPEDVEELKHFCKKCTEMMIVKLLDISEEIPRERSKEPEYVYKSVAPPTQQTEPSPLAPEEIPISGVGQDITITSERPVKLRVSGTGNDITVPHNVTVIEIDIIGIGNIIHIPQSANPKVKTTGLGSMVVRY